MIAIRFVITTLLAHLISLAPPSTARAAGCEEIFKVSPWFSTIDFSETERELASGKIASRMPLHEALRLEGREVAGTTQGMELVTFASGIRAVFKPGEANLPEVSAYNWAKRVRFRLIPPTVDRTFDGVRGSLQYYVDTPIDLLKLSYQERRRWLESGPRWQLDERNAFNFVFGNWDLNWGNLLVDASLSKAQIDNRHVGTRQQVRYGERPFVRRMPLSKAFLASLGAAAVREKFEGAFPFDQAIYFEKPTLEEVEAFLKPFADPLKLADYIQRRGKAGTPDLTMRIALWRDGVWIQAIGFQAYGLQEVANLRPNVRKAYESLTFEMLTLDSPFAFADEAIFEILDRRDQLLRSLR